MYNLVTHNMDKIVQDFDAETEQGYPDEQGQLEEQEIAK
jgi:hypothetical protein